MSPKRRTKAPRGAQAPRPRDKQGRWLGTRQIAALKAVKTRERKAKETAKATAARVRAAKHGEQARLKTTRQLTPAQVERRRKDARRVTQKVRRQTKKAQGATARPGLLSPLTSSPGSMAPLRKSRSKPVPSTEYATVRGDRFAAQFGVVFDMPAGFTPTPELIRAAVLHKARTGEDAPRTHVKILRWRNPGRRQNEDRAWRQGNQGDAWLTLSKVILAGLGGEDQGEDQGEDFEDLEFDE
jgi:hypothetical protein